MSHRKDVEGEHNMTRTDVINHAIHAVKMSTTLNRDDKLEVTGQLSQLHAIDEENEQLKKQIESEEN